MRLARLFILIFAIFSPIYILITFFTFDFQLAWLPLGWGSTQFIQIMVNWVAPVLFCVAWGYVMIALGTRMANALELMSETSGLISTQYIVFYGVNAVVLLVIFLIPVVTPIVAVFGFISMVYNLLTSRVDWDDLDASTQKFVRIMSWIATIPVMMCSVLVFGELIGFSIQMFESFWDTAIIPLFYFIKALGIALSVAAFMKLYRGAIQEYDGKIKDSGNTGDILVMEGFIVGFLLMLNYYQIEFINILYIAGGFIVCMTFFFELIKGRNQKGELMHNPMGMLLFVVFFLSTFFFDKFPWLQYFLVIGSAMVFGISYVVIFLQHPDLDDME